MSDITDDTTRVHLEEGPDYINANYINVSFVMHHRSGNIRMTNFCVVRLISIVAIDYENVVTTKLSRFMVHTVPSVSRLWCMYIYSTCMYMYSGCQNSINGITLILPCSPPPPQKYIHAHTYASLYWSMSRNFDIYLLFNDWHHGAWAFLEIGLSGWPSSFNVAMVYSRVGIFQFLWNSCFGPGHRIQGVPDRACITIVKMQIIL